MGLDIYEVVLEVQEEFGVEIPDEEMQQIESVGDLYNVTINSLHAQRPDRLGYDPGSDEDVWERLKALLVHQLGVRPDEVVKSARFFHELGFD